MGLKLPDEAKKPVSDNPVSQDLAAIGSARRRTISCIGPHDLVF
jgi:hypothetical protein